MSNNFLPDEKELLMQLALDSNEAFETIYKFYSQRMYLKLLKILRSDALAQEALQDVFLTVWNKRHQIDAGKSFAAYLMCIAVNKCYDFFRKAARDKRLQKELLVAVDKEPPNAEDELIAREQSILLYEAINLLPPRRKEIFRLCKVEGKSYLEVSQHLKISLSTISDHIVKANSFLRTFANRIH